MAPLRSIDLDLVVSAKWRKEEARLYRPEKLLCARSGLGLTIVVRIPAIDMYSGFGEMTAVCG